MEEEWLLKNADIVVNCMDSLAFILVTPDIVGEDRLNRLTDWLDNPANKYVAKPQSVLGWIRLCLVIAIAAWLVLFDPLHNTANGFFETAMDHHGAYAQFLHDKLGLPPWVQYVSDFVVGLFIWGYLLFLLFAIGLAGIGIPFFFTGILHLLLVRWQITGIMLVLGVMVFTLSRGLAIWHAAHGGG